MIFYQTFAAARIVLLVLLAGIFLVLAAGRPLSRSLRLLVAGVALAAVISYPNFGFFHPRHGDAIHYWDAFHYFMGAKYLPELGYTGLYEATLVAGRELGAFDYVTQIRDLRTYALREAAALDARAVRGRFGPERWEAFKRDLVFFGPRIDVWRGLLQDHGYNDPPPRALFLHLLVRSVPASRLTLAILTSLDYLLVVAAFVFVWRAFGTLPAALALSTFALSFFARFDFIGGSILRWDWVVALLMWAVALARGWGAAAGLCLGYAVLARVFPVLFMVPLLMKWVQGWSRRAPDESLRRCLVAAGGLILTVTAGVVFLSGGTGYVEQFLAKIRLHGDSPFVNQVGLGPLLVLERAPWSHDAAGGLYVPHVAALAARPAGYVLLVLSALCLVVALPLILRARTLESVMYAVPLIFCAASLSGYYYSFLVLLVLLPWQQGHAHPLRLVGMAVLALTMAASFTSEVAGEPLFVVLYKGTASLAAFLVVWLVLEYAHLVLLTRKPAAASGSQPGHGRAKPT